MSKNTIIEEEAKSVAMEKLLEEYEAERQRYAEAKGGVKRMVAAR